jgi:hypothetical protein
MQTPTEFELEHAWGEVYDPVKAHAYYERTKELKGRKRGQTKITSAQLSGKGLPKYRDPRTGKTLDQIHKEAKAKQRKALSAGIQSLSKKLQRLEARILEMEAEESSENRKGKAKKERAAKEAAKPKTVAEKAEAARESEKYRDKNQQKLKSDAKDAKSGGGSTKDTKSKSKSASLSDLKARRTKVKGQIAVAKQKLAAL